MKMSDVVLSSPIWITNRKIMEQEETIKQLKLDIDVLSAKVYAYESKPKPIVDVMIQCDDLNEKLDEKYPEPEPIITKPKMDYRAYLLMKGTERNIKAAVTNYSNVIKS